MLRERDVRALAENGASRRVQTGLGRRGEGAVEVLASKFEVAVELGDVSEIQLRPHLAHWLSELTEQLAGRGHVGGGRRVVAKQERAAEKEGRPGERLAVVGGGKDRTRLFEPRPALVEGRSLLDDAAAQEDGPAQDG